MTYIIGIETSCDETAASVTKNGREVLSNVVYSQIDIHEKYGGVVPEIASRKHIDKIDAVVKASMKEADITCDDLSAVAVTNTPGLVGALLVGVNYAKGFAYAAKKPLVAVNHIEGHIAANYITNPEIEPPFVCLVASGGHSHILHMKSFHEFDILGRTTDDAAGEAFDKVARVLGLGYPGGPKLSRLAKEGRDDAIAFPRPRHGLDFSFSGVKTAVINYVHNAQQSGKEINKADVAASFQKSVTDVLVRNTIEAAEAVNSKIICMAGGVSANELLRSSMAQAAQARGMKLFMPEISLCTDNAAMISMAGYLNFMAGIRSPLNLNAVAQLTL
ncbi:MAG: tRNA (adenosine(37)-N6)-threonylcarbamoyltransferase complex transferase subunit TsaD [Clostridia bacterium]|nr:tRNA (adenosine(37)-N6)-threonylcarbamoyltransferase complex transferase subunit TsaD [Clostridia bacterium]